MYSTSITVYGSGVNQNRNKSVSITSNDPESYSFSKEFTFDSTYNEDIHTFTCKSPKNIKSVSISGYRDNHIEIWINGTMVYHSWTSNKYEDSYRDFSYTLSSSQLSLIGSSNTIKFCVYNAGMDTKYNAVITITY